MNKNFNLIFLILVISIPFNLLSQITSLTFAQGLSAGTYTFNFGNGNFQGYIDDDGWLLWMQYHHQGGTNPSLRTINPGNDLPIFDSSGLGTDLSGDPSKWGHGAQTFAVGIPDDELWLRWEAETTEHNRKIHFESPVLGKFLSDSENHFTPGISYKNIHRSDHTANLPDKATATTGRNGGNRALVEGPFWNFNKYSWELNSGGRWNVDNVRNTDGSLILAEHSTIHRVWVKPIPFNSNALILALNELKNHINGINLLTSEELNQIKNKIYIYSKELASSELIIKLAQTVVHDYDEKIGPLFTTSNTRNGFNKDRSLSPGLDLERAMIALQQGLFDNLFTPDVYNKFPALIDGFKFNSSVSFPGSVDPPNDPSIMKKIAIRANFTDPVGINPSYDINSDGTEHAYRPTGMYLAPGSVATVIVPSSLIGKDYYIRVGAHEWDLNDKPIFKRLDRITKKFLINDTTIKIFNPLGGAISILVPYGAMEGIVDVSIFNAVEAPFYSLKSFFKTEDFASELNKPAPWAVFETDNVMFSIPKHSIVPGKYNLMQSMLDWDTALQAINTILNRQLISEKHDLYMISDVLIRGGAYSIGYPMSNDPINFSSVPGPSNFIDGPGPKYETHFHEYGHAVRISKFPGEQEALVNFLYIIAMNFGLEVNLNEAVKFSFVPNTFDINKSATHRLVSNSFGADRDISNTTKDEVRYQHRGYAHYFEIVNLLGWCPYKNFWENEYIDFQNGIDHDINDQDIDSRILRMSIAAGEDLRPLLHVYGILPKNQVVLEDSLIKNNIPPSLKIYNRLIEYINLIPRDNAAFLDYALSVYPNLNTSGPNDHPDYGVGWHYLKSLTYDAIEAQQRIAILQNIINLYYPNGQPDRNNNPSTCCIGDDIIVEIINGQITVSGGKAPYNISIDTVGNKQFVEVVDSLGCLSSAEFIISSLSKEATEFIKIYPNPASTKLSVDLKGNKAKIKSLEIFSVIGQLINSYPNDFTEIDITQLNQGIYILQIELSNGVIINKKVMIKK